MDAMEVSLGFDEEQRDIVCGIVTGILWLGNVTFDAVADKSGKEGAKVSAGPARTYKYIYIYIQLYNIDKKAQGEYLVEYMETTLTHCLLYNTNFFEQKVCNTSTYNQI